MAGGFVGFLFLFLKLCNDFITLERKVFKASYRSEFFISWWFFSNICLVLGVMLSFNTKNEKLLMHA
jgi:hypothetical protein